MRGLSSADIRQAIDWCSESLDPCTVRSDVSKVHPGRPSATLRMKTPRGPACLKVYSSRACWHAEVHAYEHWASALGTRAPKLLAASPDRLKALVITELPGRIALNMRLPRSRERAMWRAAGKALTRLHDLPPGTFFGACLRNGARAAAAPRRAEIWVARGLRTALRQARRMRLLSPDESATVQAASGLVSAFAGERPRACHRDYCADNWLVDRWGSWTGVIDFEASRWDVRAVDFARDPNWTWMHRPDLEESFRQGYGHPVTPAEARRILVKRCEYALGAIVWGRRNRYFGFEREGRACLAHLAPSVR